MASGDVTATGILGSSAPANTNNTELYQPASGKKAVCAVHVCNIDGTNTANARIALSTEVAASPPTPATSEWLVYDYSVAPGEFLQLSGIVVGASERLVVRTSVADDLAFNCFGEEEEL